MAKIGIYYSFPAGGIGRYNLEWLRALASPPTHELEYVSLPELAWDDSIPCAHWPGLFSISSSFVPWRKAKFLIGQVLNPSRAIQHTARNGCQLIHFTDVNHLSYPLWKQQLNHSGMKVVVTAHDVKRQVAVLNREYEDRQLRAIYRRADAILVHAEAQAQELMEFADVKREQVHIVPHGPYSYGDPGRSRDEVRNGYGFAADDVVGLCFGQLRDEKNLEGLIGALAENDSRSKLLVAGKAGSHHRGASDYAAIAKQAGVANRVVFDERFIPDSEVADLVSACDWIAVPYRRDFTSMSGVLNLACHYRKPVLCGEAPALAEAVRKHDIGKVVEKEGGLPEALVRIEARLSSGSGAFNFEGFASANTWEENARLTERIYQRLLQGENE
ncbi:glycosyltransferase family 4 protein [Akkermansiaceae bacterium]|nr:glycosyltransferase family 4 protein [Akkermansiaceae bacterium]